MSASVRSGLRLAVLCAVLLSGACRVGRNPAVSPSATSPRGVQVNLRWNERRRGQAASGELLGSDERGVYLLHTQTIVLYPFGAPLVLRPDHRPPDPLSLEDASDTTVREFTQYARYPFGIDDAVLERMLDALGMDSVVVRRRP